MSNNSTNTPVEESTPTLKTNVSQYNEVYTENDEYSDSVEINPEVVYLTIPVRWIATYRKLLTLIADGGKAILDDCSYGCKGNGSIIFNCWNLFQSACVHYSNGSDKGDFFINYINKQIDSYIKSNNIKISDTSIKYTITADGKAKADGTIVSNHAFFSLDKENYEKYVEYEASKDIGKVYTEKE